MTERDAFGNEIPATPGAARPEPAGPPPDPVPRRRGGGCVGTAVALLVVALIVTGVVALAVIGLGSSETTATTSNVTPEAATTAAPKPASLLRAGALADALARLHDRGRLRLLRVAPDHVYAQLVTSSGALRNVQVTNAGELRDLGTGGAGVGGLPTIPFAQVDARAPARMVRVASTRAGRRPSRVDYLVLLMLPTGQSWNLYFKPDGLHFAGDLHGRHVVQR